MTTPVSTGRLLTPPQRPRRHRGASRQLLAALLLGLGLASCGGDDAPPVATDTVEVFGPFRGSEATLFTDSFEDFQEATGISIRYTGTGSFVGDLEAQIQAADPPDIAMIPQPGLVADLADRGHARPLAAEGVAALEANYTDQTRALGEVDGVATGVPYRLSLKSLVWYRPAVFDELGLTSPTTLAQLEEVAARLRQEDIAPWCMGIEAQGATGWVATDWTEDLVLRLAGASAYDDWVAGALPFADPAIADAYSTFQELALAPGQSAGGVSAIVRTSTQDAAAELFADPVSCGMHRQANFAAEWLPSDLSFGPDSDVHFFVLPGVDADGEVPLLVGSTQAVAFTDDPGVNAVMAHLASPAAARAWAEAGGFLSPHRSVTNEDDLPAVDRAARDLLVDAQVVRPDASDSMAPEIGSGLLWSEITQWVAGTITFADLAATVDAARTDAADS